MDETWRNYAACEGLELSVDFFPEQGEDPTEALRVCAVCPVAAECLDYALRLRIKFGVWGGTTERQRRKLRSGNPPPRVCVICQDHPTRGHSLYCEGCATAISARWHGDHPKESVARECVVCGNPAVRRFGRPAAFPAACDRWECQRTLECRVHEHALHESARG